MALAQADRTTLASASFFSRTASVATTTRTEAATVIQTRHSIPKAALTEDQILVLSGADV